MTLRTAGVVDTTSPIREIRSPLYLQVGDHVLVPYWKNDEKKIKDYYYLAIVSYKASFTSAIKINFYADSPEVIVQVPERLYKRDNQNMVKATANLVWDYYYIGLMTYTNSEREIKALIEICPRFGRFLIRLYQPDSLSSDDSSEEEDENNITL